MQTDPLDFMELFDNCFAEVCILQVDEPKTKVLTLPPKGKLNQK